MGKKVSAAASAPKDKTIRAMKSIIKRHTETIKLQAETIAVTEAIIAKQTNTIALLNQANDDLTALSFGAGSGRPSDDAIHSSLNKHLCE